MRAGEEAAALEAARAQVNLCIHAYRRAIGGKLEGRRRGLLAEAEAKLWALEEEAGIPLQVRIEALNQDVQHWEAKGRTAAYLTSKDQRFAHEQLEKAQARRAQLRARLERSEVAAGDG